MPSSSGPADRGDVPSSSLPTFLPTFGHAVGGPCLRAAQRSRVARSPPVTLLIGHGTRDAEGAREALDFAARLADHLASQPGWAAWLIPCFLELTDPPILPTIAGCVEAGAERDRGGPAVALRGEPRQGTSRPR